MGEWQPIETAPKDGTEALFWDARYSRVAIAKCGSDGRPFEGDWDYEVPASHWMPLPSPPVDGEDGTARSPGASSREESPS